MSNNDSILNHPHSRFVASTNYIQHYTKQYENEIVSKKKEFDHFFTKYKDVKGDAKAFSDLANMLQKKRYQDLENYRIKNLNSQFNILTETNEKRGALLENYDFLRASLESIDAYTKETNKYLKSNSRVPDISNEENGNEFSLEKQLNKFTEEGNNLTNQIFQLENEADQEILDKADEQILEAKKQRNSDLSLY